MATTLLEQTDVPIKCKSNLSLSPAINFLLAMTDKFHRLTFELATRSIPGSHINCIILLQV